MSTSLTLVHSVPADIDVTSRRSDAVTDLDAERAVLGAVLLDGGDAGVFERVSQLLDADRFASPAHAAIWRAMAALHARGVAHDVTTLAAELRAAGALHAVGGPQALGALTDDVITTAHAETHARLVFDASVRRWLGLFGARLAAAAADPQRDPGALRDAAVEALQRLRVTSSATPPDDAHALVTDLAATIRAGREGRTRGALPFGVGVLDRMSDGGMKRGGLYVLAARPGVGKTALASQIAGAVAASGEGVLYVALEPTKGDITQSLAASLACVDLTKITRRPELLTTADVEALDGAFDAISRWPLHAVDRSAKDRVDTIE
ncbi:MAG TPA: DnaB-like helicase N-terminal domain-containing protein, partial [Gemmatimonadaceae bacterium]|nr:DnaB-like helicase N-terminal domain-containing protein [Gemmatimonadaceae bacterium]